MGQGFGQAGPPSHRTVLPQDTLAGPHWAGTLCWPRATRLLVVQAHSGSAWAARACARLQSHGATLLCPPSSPVSLFSPREPCRLVRETPHSYLLGGHLLRVQLSAGPHPPHSAWHSWVRSQPARGLAPLGPLSPTVLSGSRGPLRAHHQWDHNM